MHQAIHTIEWLFDLIIIIVANAFGLTTFVTVLWATIKYWRFKEA